MRAVPSVGLCRLHLVAQLTRSAIERARRFHPSVSADSLLWFYITAPVLFAQVSQQPMLTPKANASSNFDDRPNDGILRPPTQSMFYDFAPHGDGANSGRPPVRVHGCLALRLLYIAECVVAEVVRS